MNKVQKFWTAYKSISRDPARLFLLVGGTFGLLFVFLFPPFQVIDEPSHFYRAYQLSQGDVLGQKIDGKSGGQLPDGITNGEKEYQYLFFRYEEKASPRGIIDDAVHMKVDEEKQTFTTFNNTVLYPPVTYLPQAIAIRISTLLQTSPLVSFYFARIASLTVWLFVLYWVIKKIPVGKWAVFVIALFPMVVSQAASISADATINTLCFLAVGLIVNAIYTPKLLRKDLMLLVGVGLALAMTKTPYALLLLLMLAIPKTQFPKTFSKTKFLLVLFSSVAIITLAWMALVNTIHVDLRLDTSASNQLHGILQHPQTLIKAFLLFPLMPQISTTLSQLYGLLGWNEIGLPVWLIMYGYGCLFLALMQPSQIRITRSTRMIAGGIILLAFIAISSLLYLSWMPVGGTYLYDIWGRYFSGVLALAVPLMYGVLNLDTKSWAKAQRFIAYSVPVALLIVSFLIWNRYYFHLRLY